MFRFNHYSCLYLAQPARALLWREQIKGSTTNYVLLTNTGLCEITRSLQNVVVFEEWSYAVLIGLSYAFQGNFFALLQRAHILSRGSATEP